MKLHLKSGHVLDPLKGIDAVKGDLREINFGHILAIITKLDDSEPWELHLPGGLFVLSDGKSLSFTKKKQKNKKINTMNAPAKFGSKNVLNIRYK